MKLFRVLALVVVGVMLLTMVVSCAAPTPQVVEKVVTQIVEKEKQVQVEKVVTQVVEKEKIVQQTVRGGADRGPRRHQLGRQGG